MKKIPVLILGFKRPKETMRVLNAIRSYHPSKLYFAVDGHREDNNDERIQNQEVKGLVRNIDWKCEVFTRFSEINQGMRNGVINAINWFFEQEEHGIILEDDVLPNQDFFRFMEEMLDKYRSDRRVMHVSGCNVLGGVKFGSASYYYSRLTNIWGWGTWRDRWKMYSPELEYFESFKVENRFKDVLKGDRNKWLLKLVLKSAYTKQNTWDYQWQFSVLANHGLVITPNVNMIENIGFGSNGTTASDISSSLANLKTQNLGSILHPKFMIPYDTADKLFNKITLRQIPLWKLAMNFVARRLKIKLF